MRLIAMAGWPPACSDGGSGGRVRHAASVARAAGWIAALLAVGLVAPGCGEAEDLRAGEDAGQPGLAEQVHRVREGESVTVRVDQRRLTETELEKLSGLDGLRRLVLEDTGINDAGLRRLKGLPNLALLRISGGRVTDAGLAHVAAMPALRHLILVDLPITDAGLRRLHGMGRLESLYLFGSKAAASGFRELRRARPDLHLHW